MNRTVEFIYDRTTRRPRRLKNNVFVLYSPKKIRIQPGEKINIDMKLKIECRKISLVLVRFYKHLTKTESNY